MIEAAWAHRKRRGADPGGERNLAPGDCRTVRQSLHWLGGAEGAGGKAALLDALAAEAAFKRDGGKGRIGF
jgi:hypothetical protein